METDKIVDFMLDVSQKLGSIESKLSSVCESILAHESRITMLEHKVDIIKNCKTDDGDFKSKLLLLLAKSVLIGLSVIATSSGAAALIQKILNW